MRGRDAKTRQLRTIAISPGDTMHDVAHHFTTLDETWAIAFALGQGVSLFPSL